MNAEDFEKYYNSLTPEERSKAAEGLKRFQRLLEIGKDRLKGTSYTSSDLKKTNFDSYMNIDLYIEEFREGIMKGINEGQDIQTYIYILEMLKSNSEVELNDPFKESQVKKIKYLIGKYDNLIKILNITKDLHKDQREYRRPPKEETHKRYAAKYLVITFILDCEAKNEPYTYDSKQGFIKDIKQAYPDYQKLTGNREYVTLYNVFSKRYMKNLTKIKNLNDNFLYNELGEDWKEDVLSISRDKKTLKHYLERNNQ